MQEECSVDTVQMLVGQLKTREQELAKKGRIVDYEREAALAGVRTMIHDLEGPVRRAASFFFVTRRDAVDATQPAGGSEPGSPRRQGRVRPEQGERLCQQVRGRRRPP